ncbi:MAG: dephospho-CoA kinase [Erysipelotrichaceae bacterium]|nr:dephospho-CoA kinase [Erysipelotrichaceae bacterium]
MKIAITGTIGSGKTVVSDYLRSKGYDVFDCDRVNAQLLEENRKGYVAVKKLFPECFDGNSLDKKALAKAVFSDPEKKKKLEDAMHPLILKELKKKKMNLCLRKCRSYLKPDGMFISTEIFWS